MRKLLPAAALAIVFSVPVLAGEVDGPPKAQPCNGCLSSVSATDTVRAAIIALVLSMIRQ